MPKLPMRIEIHFDPIDDEGHLRGVEASWWPIESALDYYTGEYGENQDGSTYTRTVVKTQLGAASELETDRSAANEWHEDRCDGEDECQADEYAQEKYPCVFEWDDDGEQYRKGDRVKLV